MEDQAAEIEIKPRKRRRVFSDSYKRRILRDYDRCTQHGEKGALLRREGLYDSTISRWRKQMANKSRTRRGRPNKTDEQKEMELLRAKVAQLESSLEEAHHVIDVQKKLCDALETLRRSKPSETSSSTPSTNSDSE